MIPWIYLRLVFPNLLKSLFFHLNSSSNLIKFEEYLENSLFFYGFDSYSPLTNCLLIKNFKLVSLVVVLTFMCVFNECTRNYHHHALTRRNHEVVDFKRYRVKNYSKLTNFRKFTRIEGYNGKYGSNPQGIKEFLDSVFNFDPIEREIDGRNWGKWYFKKLDFKLIPRNQKSSNLDLISRRNQDSKWREISGD